MRKLGCNIQSKGAAGAALMCCLTAVGCHRSERPEVFTLGPPSETHVPVMPQESETLELASWQARLDGRERALKAWAEVDRAVPESRGLLREARVNLARGFFPQFAMAGQGAVGPQAMQVQMPEVSDGAIVLDVDGLRYKLSTRWLSDPSGVKSPKAALSADGVTFYGTHRFWGSAGAGRLHQGTGRMGGLEEFFVYGNVVREHRSEVRIEVPVEVSYVRDAQSYLELLDGNRRPLLRIHYPVAIDARGYRRRASNTLHGVRAVGTTNDLATFALISRTMVVESRMPLQDMQPPIVVDPLVQPTVGQVADGRYTHTTTLLPDGRVLIAGGYSGVFLASTEIFDPRDGTWMAGPPLPLATGRAGHTALLLHDGTVLIVGGAGGSGILNSCATLDASAQPLGAWVLIPLCLDQGRQAHSMHLIADGGVTVVDGAGAAGYFSDVEFKDATSSTFSPQQSFLPGRGMHVSVLLDDGDMIVSGGLDGTSPATADAQRVSAMGEPQVVLPIAEIRALHTGTRLRSGKVVLIGGWGGSAFDFRSDADLYSPGASTLPTFNGVLQAGRQGHSATLLPSGRVLVAGGYAQTKSPTINNFYKFVDAIAPNGQSGAALPAMGTGRSLHTATMLASGDVLLTSGQTTLTSSTPTSEVYSALDEVVSAVPDSQFTHTDNTVTLLGNGDVMVVGSEASVAETAEKYSPIDDWSSESSGLTYSRVRHTATLLLDGKLYVVGGYGRTAAGAADNVSSSHLQSVEIFDGNQWSPGPPLNAARSRHTATRLANGHLMVYGGCNDNGCSSALHSIEIFDGTSWTEYSGLLPARRNHQATLMPDGSVVISGGYVGSTLGDVWRLTFSPSTGVPFSLQLEDLGIPGDEERHYHSQTLLNSGLLLIAGGNSGGVDRNSLLYDPQKNGGTVVASMSMNTPRRQHAATLLPSGKVLVTGGRDASSTIGQAEIFDPATRTWSVFGTSVPTARSGHDAVLMPGGTVLVIGGVNTVERFHFGNTYPAWRPSFNVPVTATAPGSTITLNGTMLGGAAIPEGSSGNSRSSPTNYAVVNWQAWNRGPGAVFEGGTYQLSGDGTSLQITVPSSLSPGDYHVWAAVNGIVGGSDRMIVTDCIPAGSEDCDGIDNDCDGFIDEGLQNQPEPGVTGACAANLRDCVAGGWVGDAANITAAADDATCNAEDEDCDGSTDEDASSRSISGSKGKCASNTEVCSSGGWTPASGNYDAVAEICDGLDNNCDGANDELLIPRLTTLQLGMCQSDQEICSGSSGWTAASGNHNPTAEQCDALDHDCDGSIDAGVTSLPSVNVQGLCADNVDVCSAGAWVASTNNYTATSESCDGNDNNCDGATDENIASAPAANVHGLCAGNTVYCDGGQMMESLNNYKITDEVCDGLDNDCDNVVDNGIGATCQCTSALPINEVCDDGIDNDCDDRIDEDCFGPGNAQHVRFVDLIRSAPVTETGITILAQAFDSAGETVVDAEVELCFTVQGITGGTPKLTAIDFPQAQSSAGGSSLCGWTRADTVSAWVRVEDATAEEVALTVSSLGLPGSGTPDDAAMLVFSPGAADHVEIRSVGPTTTEACTDSTLTLKVADIYGNGVATHGDLWLDVVLAPDTSVPTVLESSLVSDTVLPAAAMGGTLESSAQGMGLMTISAEAATPVTVSISGDLQGAYSHDFSDPGVDRSLSTLTASSVQFIPGDVPAQVELTLRSMCGGAVDGLSPMMSVATGQISDVDAVGDGIYRATYTPPAETPLCPTLARIEAFVGTGAEQRPVARGLTINIGCPPEQALPTPSSCATVPSAAGPLSQFLLLLSFAMVRDRHRRR